VTQSLRFLTPGLSRSHNKLSQVVHMLVALSYQSKVVVLYGWEDFHRFGIALGICHRYEWFIHLWAS